MFDEQWAARAAVSEPSAADRARRARRARRHERRQRYARLVRRTFLWGVVFALGAGAVVWYVEEDPAGAGDDPRAAARADAGDRPSLRAAGEDRVLNAVPIVAGERRFELLDTWRSSPGRPITYDPCRPVDVVVNPHLAPATFAPIVERTLATASEASGIAFRVESIAADEPPSMPRSPFQPERYGDRWSPVLIAWTTPDVVPDLVGTVAGVGGSTWVESDVHGAWNVSGAVVLDAAQLAGDRTATEAVLLHELGHVLGLAHTADPDQLMHRSSTQHTLNDGDRAGFATVGSGDCAPPL